MAISISYTIYNFIYGEGHITPNIFSFKHRDEKQKKERNPNCAVIDKVTHRANGIQWEQQNFFKAIDDSCIKNKITIKKALSLWGNLKNLVSLIKN